LLNRKRRLIEIKDIDTPEKDLHKLKQFKALRPESWRTVDTVKIIRGLCGGVCVICMETPSKIVKYDMGNGSVLIERYCNECLEHIDDDLHSNGIDQKVEIKNKK